MSSMSESLYQNSQEFQRELERRRESERSSSGLLLLLEAFAIVGLVAAALIGIRHQWSGPRSNRSEVLALVLIAAFTVALPKSFWVESKDFRTLAELWLLAGIVLLSSPRRHYAVLGLTGLAFFGVFGFRALVI